MQKRLSLLIACLLFLLTACDSDVVCYEPIQYVPSTQNITRYHKKDIEVDEAKKILPPHYYSEVSYNYACSINAAYASNDRLWYYDYATTFTTDGTDTKMYQTNKFLGNYGVQPIEIVPHVESANAIYVDFNDYYQPQDYDIKVTDDNEYDWYFFTPQLLKSVELTPSNECTLYLSGIKFNVSLTLSESDVEQIHMKSLTKTKAIDSIEITLTLLKGADEESKT